MELGLTVTDHGHRIERRPRLRDRTWVRIATIAGASGVSGVLFYSHVSMPIAGHPAFLVAGLLYATLIGLSAAFVFRFLPAFASFMEFTTASRLILATAAAFEPTLANTLTTSPFVNATLIVLGGLLLKFVVQPDRATRLVSAMRHVEPAPVAVSTGT